MGRDIYTRQTLNSTQQSESISSSRHPKTIASAWPWPRLKHLTPPAETNPSVDGVQIYLMIETPLRGYVLANPLHLERLTKDVKANTRQ